MTSISSPTHGANNLNRSPVKEPNPNTLSNSSVDATPMNVLNMKRNTESDVSGNDVGLNTPLIQVEKVKPPLADSETDDSGDDREVVTNPYPGVDDGFFSKPNGTDPKSENVPTAPPANGEFPNEDEPDGLNRRFFPRLNPDGPNHTLSPSDPQKPTDHLFPDIELGTTIPDLESIPDVNVYQHKKTLAQGMMDLALFSANANQLRYVLESNQHPYFYPGLVMISISLIMQVAVGVGLIWNSRYNVKDEKEICIANKINNFTIIGIFLVVVINVFISAFGVVHNP